MLILMGVLIVLVVIYLLIKQYETLSKIIPRDYQRRSPL